MPRCQLTLRVIRFGNRSKHETLANSLILVELYWSGTGIATFHLLNAGMTVKREAEMRIRVMIKHAIYRLAGLLLFGVTSTAIALPMGLVSHWSAEGNALDSAGNNHGVLEGGVGFTTGVFGQVFLFDGINDVVSLGMPGDLQFTDEFTIAAWVRRDRLDLSSLEYRYQGPIFFAGQGGYGFSVMANSGAELTKIGTSEIISAPLFTDTEFHHLAAIYDFGLTKFYFDGVEVFSTFYALGFEYPATNGISANDMGIGARADMPSSVSEQSLLGAIDELQIYNRSLDVNEIRLTMAAPNAPELATLALMGLG